MKLNRPPIKPQLYQNCCQKKIPVSFLRKIKVKILSCLMKKIIRGKNLFWFQQVQIIKNPILKITLNHYRQLLAQTKVLKSHISD